MICASMYFGSNAPNSFSGAFLVAGIVLLVGILAYGFMLGRIEPIPDPEPV